MNKNNRGFTLVELIGVLVVIAVLSIVATGSTISIINKVREKTAVEMRDNLKEAALTYVISEKNIHLTKCSASFSEKVYTKNDISELSKNASCTKTVTVATLKEEGVFADKKGYCNHDEEVLVYRYCDESENCEYKTYISDTACTK